VSLEYPNECDGNHLIQSLRRKSAPMMGEFLFAL
jgi:hypothetical protein